MESIKRIGQACRQHYEKILLSLALVGLAGAVGVLYMAGQQSDPAGSAPPIKKKAGPVDLSRHTEAMRLLASPPSLDFSPPHNLLNPVKWQRKPDGSLLKIQTGAEVGVSQIEITMITPLHYSIEIYRVASESSAFLRVTDEAAEDPRQRLPRSKFVNKEDNVKNEVFTLRDWQGGKEDPSLTLELVASQETVTVTKDAPYKKVRAYSADLKYQIDGRSYTKAREGDEIRFGGEDYKIVAIHRDEVVLSAVLNKRKHTIKYTGG